MVDDGSADGTAQVTRELIPTHPGLRLVSHPANRGYGAAVRTGLESATMDYVFFSDADLQFDPGELGLLIEHIGEYDLVTGYRQHRKDNAVRKLNAGAWGALMRLALGVRARDIDCAFKLFTREILDRIGLDSLRSEGAFISAEILARLAHAGGRIKEVPVSHFDRRAGAQTGANPRVILRAFRELFKLRREIRRPGG